MPGDSGSDQKWDAIKKDLLALSDQHEWLDEEEVTELVRTAYRKNVPTQVILACRESCHSDSGFVHHLSGLIGKRRRRILAVDDEPDFLDLLKTSLEHSKKYSVETTTDPHHALEIVEKIMPDLCIIDVKMPDMDGRELVKLIHERSHLRDVPTIMLTGILTDTAVEAVAKDHILYLSKPVVMKELIFCIDEHLAGFD